MDLTEIVYGDINRIGSMVGSCDRCNKHSDAMKFGEFLDHQSELLLLSKDSAP
jgi:hypothetical protein